MGVLCDLTDQGAAVAVGHPVSWLDLLLGVDDRLETFLGCHAKDYNKRTFVCHPDTRPVLCGMIRPVDGNRTLEALVASATDAIVTADREGHIVTWNPASEAMFGYSEQELIGQSLTSIVPERFREAHSEGLARVSSGGETRIVGQTVQVAGRRK